METRILSTQIWRDEFFGSLDHIEQKIALFLLTNDKIPTLPVYRISIKEIAFYCSTTNEKVESTVGKLKPVGIFFQLGYFFIEDKYTRAKYTGGKTEKARERVWSGLPSDVKELIDTEGRIGQSLANGCPTIGNYNHKPETINNKPETRNQKPGSKKERVDGNFLSELGSKYPNVDVPRVWEKLENYCKANGKTYKDYRAALRNWVLREDETNTSNMAKGGVARFAKRT